MKDTGMIDIFSTNRYSVISVCNWSEYQSRKSEHQNEHLNEHQNEHVESIDNSAMQEYEEQQNGQPMNNQTTQYKNGKNEKNNKYSQQEEDIFNFWNSKKIIVHKFLTEDMVKAINNALKKYSLENIYEAITNYAVVYHDKNYFFKYKWSLETFLSRKKVLKKFLTDGENYHNYLDHKKESNQNTFKSQNNGSNNNYQKNTVRGAAETSKSINEIKKKMEAS